MIVVPSLKLEVITRGAPPSPSSFEGPREELERGAPEYPSQSLLEDQRQHKEQFKLLVLKLVPSKKI